MKGRPTTPIARVGLALWIALRTLAFGQDLNPSAPSPAAADLDTLSPVVVSENPDVVQRFNVNPVMTREMLDRAILKLTSASDLGTAWTRLGVTPQDIVGIKITTVGGPLLSTHRPLIQAICDGLQAAGLSPSRIIIWDKLQDDMVHAGYSPVRSTERHVGIASVFPGTGYDPAVFYKNELVGTLIWGDSEFISRDPMDGVSDATRNSLGGGRVSNALDAAPVNTLDIVSGVQTSNKSYYASLLTTICTKIINVPVLTDNSYIGMEGCLGSLALGSVDNSRRFQGDPTYGDPAICEILNPAFVRRKVIIHILDALVAEYAGGPHFNPLFTQSIGALYVSRDPVAIDSLVLPRLERWRKQAHIDPIGKTASHISDAAAYRLGTDDPSRIQLIRLP